MRLGVRFTIALWAKGREKPFVLRVTCPDEVEDSLKETIGIQTAQIGQGVYDVWVLHTEQGIFALNIHDVEAIQWATEDWND